MTLRNEGYICAARTHARKHARTHHARTHARADKRARVREMDLAPRAKFESLISLVIDVICRLLDLLPDSRHIKMLYRKYRFIRIQRRVFRRRTECIIYLIPLIPQKKREIEFRG